MKSNVSSSVGFFFRFLKSSKLSRCSGLLRAFIVEAQFCTLQANLLSCCVLSINLGRFLSACVSYCNISSGKPKRNSRALIISLTGTCVSKSAKIITRALSFRQRWNLAISSLSVKLSHFLNLRLISVTATLNESYSPTVSTVSIVKW